MHKLTNIDTDERTAVCAECGPVRVRLRGEGGAFRCNNSGRQGSQGNGRVRQSHTPEGRQLLAQSDGRCQMCGDEAKLCVDHDHTSGRVRGLLCHRCNIGLGYFGDDITRLEGAIEYLKRTTHPST